MVGRAASVESPYKFILYSLPPPTPEPYGKILRHEPYNIYSKLKKNIFIRMFTIPTFDEFVQAGKKNLKGTVGMILCKT